MEKVDPCFAFRAPAYSDETTDKPALDLLAPIAFGENSDIYQKLVLKEQKVDELSVALEDRRDPELFIVSAKVKDAKDIDYVRQQILDTYKRYTTQLIPKDKLDSTRSRLRYSFALAMDSSEAIASSLAPYGGVATVALRVQRADWAPYAPGQDWSYTPSAVPVPAPHLTLAVDGRLVWGASPLIAKRSAKP